MSKVTTSKFWADLGERVFWTAAQAGLAVIGVDQFDLPQWAIVPIGAGLAFLKAQVARHIGQADTAATLPASKAG